MKLLLKPGLQGELSETEREPYLFVRELKLISVDLKHLNRNRVNQDRLDVGYIKVVER